jgi:AcrR family transcriptional regulator
MGARAESAKRTREQVLDAAAECFGDQDYDTVSLKDIAKRAGVGLQTVVRTAGSKEALFALVAERFLTATMDGFDLTRMRTWRDALDYLMTFYETYGDRTMRVIIHEHRVPEVREYTQRSRALQAAWIQLNHGAAFDGLSERERKRRLAMVLTLTGGRTWYALRRDYGLSAEETKRSIAEQLEALLDATAHSA